MRLTFIIPVYNERDTLERLAEGIMRYAADYDHTILFVDDGSTDGSYEILLELEERHEAVQVLRLRGNFGKSLALTAGFAHVDGDLVFTMDSDLQDDPKEIPRFLEKLEEGYDMVCGWKSVRNDPWHKVIPSKYYNKAVSWLFDVPIHDVNCGYKLMRREVVKNLHIYGEMHRLIPVVAHSLNFRITEIPVEHHRRQYGVSKFGFERFSRGALDVLTMWFLSNYRHQPGHFFGKLGGLQILFGWLCLGLCIIVFFLMDTQAISAALLAVGLVFGATGAVTISLGLLAEMILHHLMRMDPAAYIAEADQE